MSHRIRRMPFAAKVNAFETEVRRDQRFVIAGNANNSAIIANAVQHMCAGARAAPDAVNQKFFGDWQDEINIFPFRPELHRVGSRLDRDA